MVEIKKLVVNPYEEAKKERLAWLGQFLIEHEGISYLEVRGILQKKYGLSERTATEYIRIFADGVSMEFDNGRLKFLKPQESQPEGVKEDVRV